MKKNRKLAILLATCILLVQLVSSIPVVYGATNGPVTGITVNGTLIEGFDPEVTEYTYTLPKGVKSIPIVDVQLNDEFSGYSPIITSQFSDIPYWVNIKIKDDEYNINFEIDEFDTNPVYVDEIKTLPKKVMYIDQIYSGEGLTFLPEDASTKIVKLKPLPGSEEILQEIGNGKVKAIGVGTARLQIQSTDKLNMDDRAVNIMEVQVVDNGGYIPVQEVIIHEQPMEIYIGQTKQLYHDTDPGLTIVTVQEIYWTSSDENIVSVDQNGNLTSRGVGNATIRATAIGSDPNRVEPVFTEVLVTSSEFSVESIQINQITEMIIGDTAQLEYVINPVELQDEEVTWKSLNGDIAIVSDTGVVTALAKGKATIEATVDGKSDTISIQVNSPKIEFINILDDDIINMFVGDHYKLESEIGPELADPDEVEWDSSNPEVVSVSPQGDLTALSKGSVTVTLGEIEGDKHDSVVVIVDNVPELIKLDIIQETSNIKIGETTKLYHVATPTEFQDEPVRWSSSNPNIAAVDADGNVTGISKGITTITVSNEKGDVTDTIIVQVDTPEIAQISITEDYVEVIIDTTADLEYEVSPEEASKNSIVWTSSDPSVAIVTNGTVNAIKLGETIITAENPDGTIKDTVTVRVVRTPKINVITTELNLYIGDTYKIVYTPIELDELVFFTSLHPNIASSDGITVTALSPGTATIKAYTESGLEEYVTVNVENKPNITPDPSIRIQGEIVELKVNEYRELSVYTTNIDSPVIQWSSNNPDIATVDSFGRVTAVREGTTYVRATIEGTELFDSIQVNVTKPSSTENPEGIPTGKYIELKENRTTLLLEKPSYKIVAEIINGESTDNTLYFETEDDDIIDLTEAGVITGISPGDATVYIHDGQGLEVEFKVTVLDAYEYVYARSIEISEITKKDYMVGDEILLKYTVLPASSKEAKVLWETSNKSIATISSDGKVELLKPGKVTLTAKVYETKAEDTITIQVNPYKNPLVDITVDDPIVDIKVGERHKINAKLSPIDTTETGIIFSTKSKNISLTPSGEVYAGEAGEGIIEVTVKGTDIKTEVVFKVTYDEKYWDKPIAANNLKENKDIFVRFSTAIDKTSIEGNVFLSKDKSGNTRLEDTKVNIDPNNNKAIVVKAPEKGWNTGDTYYLFINTGIRDILGNTLYNKTVYELNIRK